MPNCFWAFINMLITSHFSFSYFTYIFFICILIMYVCVWGGGGLRVPSARAVCACVCVCVFVCFCVRLCMCSKEMRVRIYKWHVTWKKRTGTSFGIGERYQFSGIVIAIAQVYRVTEVLHIHSNRNCSISYRLSTYREVRVSINRPTVDHAVNN